MIKNMGNLDRTLRILIAIVVIALYYNDMISGTLAIVLLVVSAAFILTSFIGFYPLYFPFGLRTRKIDKV